MKTYEAEIVPWSALAVRDVCVNSMDELEGNGFSLGLQLVRLETLFQ